MRKTLASWRLFWVLALGISAAICLGLPGEDLHSQRATDALILRCVRLALPCFLIAFTASSWAALWPSRATRWLLSNRRYFGLAFAFGMAWHLAFVGYSMASFGVHLNRTALTLDAIGLAFLILLTITSFRWFGRQLTPSHWRRLHKSGVYAIWLLATYIYAESARGDRDLFHEAVLALMLAAWLVRAAAWAQGRLRAQTGATECGKPSSSRY